MVRAMTHSLTVTLNSQTERRLRRLASEEGASLEVLVERLLEDISVELEADDDHQLSEEQLADLRERLKNPGPLASPERVAAVLAKFKI
jgi:predicted transcriptional regulator